jgi:hypothetical protein
MEMSTFGIKEKESGYYPVPACSSPLPGTGPLTLPGRVFSFIKKYAILCA